MRIDRILLRGLYVGRYHADVVINFDMLGTHCLTFVIDAHDNGYSVKDKLGVTIFEHRFKTLQDCQTALHEQVLFSIDPINRVM